METSGAAGWEPGGLFTSEREAPLRHFVQERLARDCLTGALQPEEVICVLHAGGSGAGTPHLTWEGWAGSHRAAGRLAADAGQSLALLRVSPSSVHPLMLHRAAEGREGDVQGNFPDQMPWAPCSLTPWRNTGTPHAPLPIACPSSALSGCMAEPLCMMEASKSVQTQD